jgi:hypothetical protein
MPIDIAFPGNPSIFGKGCERTTRRSSEATGPLVHGDLRGDRLVIRARGTIDDGAPTRICEGPPPRRPHPTAK